MCQVVRPSPSGPPGFPGEAELGGNPGACLEPALEPSPGCEQGTAWHGTACSPTTPQDKGHWRVLEPPGVLGVTRTRWGHRVSPTFPGQVTAAPAQLQVGEFAEQGDAGDP